MTNLKTDLNTSNYDIAMNVAKFVQAVVDYQGFYPLDKEDDDVTIWDSKTIWEDIEGLNKADPNNPIKDNPEVEYWFIIASEHNYTPINETKDILKVLLLWYSARRLSEKLGDEPSEPSEG